MKNIRFVRSIVFVAFVAALIPGAGAVPHPQTSTPNRYNWINLQSDLAGVARNVDTNLVNSWGIAPGASGNIWVADNGTGLASVYRSDGTNTGTVVDTATSAPTGVVANTTPGFKVSGQAAQFLFASEDGLISAYNATVNATTALVVIDNTGNNAVYKGITIASNTLFAADFHNGRVDMFDANYNLISTGSTFVDPNLPAGYAPFGIAAIQGKIYVSYALQDASAHDDVQGPGNGYVDVYNPNGTFVKRLISGGHLNSPWGMTFGNTPFGHYNGGLYVGNFGDGVINIYNLQSGVFAGTLTSVNNGTPIAFDGLWGLYFQGNFLYIAAGLAHEDHGLFSYVFPVQ